MARIFITGSADGIGLAGAKLLASQGHKVTLHARNADRAAQARAAVPEAEGVLIGDLTSLDATKALAAAVNEAGPWDAIVHNAGLGPFTPYSKTADGIASLFQVNSLAPYVLTCLINKPKRLLYLSSSLHFNGDGSLADVTWQNKGWQAMSAYNDSKLHNVLIANAVARAWPSVQSCSLDPGWIKTKMGGQDAPGETGTPAEAIAAFTTGNSTLVGDRTGVYFSPSGASSPHKAATDTQKQDELMSICEKLSNGIPLPK